MTLNKQSLIAALEALEIRMDFWSENDIKTYAPNEMLYKALSLANQLGEEIDKFDYHRVREWALSKPRKPANLAFTAGTNRNAAYLIEELIYSTPAAPIKLPVKLTFLDDESVAEEVAKGMIPEDLYSDDELTAVIEPYKSLAQTAIATTDLIEQLCGALTELKAACKNEPAMNHQKYDALGILVNKALEAAKAYRLK